MAITGPTLPPEVVLEMGERLASDLWISAVLALSDAIGSERALFVLRPLMRKLGHAAGIRFGSLLGLKGDSEDDLAKAVSLMHEIMQQPTNVRKTSDGFEEAVGSCPYESSPDEVHLLFHAFAEGVCQAVGTKCRLTIERSDSVSGACRWNIRFPRRLKTSPR